MTLLHDRLDLYSKVEAMRGRPLIAYVTSSRANSTGQISGDAVAEIQEQLDRLPENSDALDLLIVSSGGDATVAWRIVSLIRERVSKFSVLVPQAAYSAATLIVLGADEIVMHPNGNLGPTDPQITAVRPGGTGTESTRFGSEDLAAFVKYAKETVGLKSETEVAQIYKKFVDDVGSVAIGVAARSAQLGISMGEKLLQMHMKEDGEHKKAKTIAERLTKDFFHHGYPLNRTEAIEIGLKVADHDAGIEQLLWEIWKNLVDDLALRTVFIPMGVVKANNDCAALFDPVPITSLPMNLPPEIQQNVTQGLLASAVIKAVPGTPYTTTHALVESSRLASRFVSRGLIFASRQMDLTYKLSNVVDFQGWETQSPANT